MTKKGRPIKVKQIQVHRECVCGLNTIVSENLPVACKDFKKLGIKLKIDKKTKKRFLFLHIKINECTCYED